eukprot:GFKZ01012636.1.p1 GENE.GFKZ01012636.1~~GFKZ01012636.1.p1  ORF type:complete len:769 (-),score=178.34 GFKZ01012636.1:2054-4360(-)
MVTLYRPPDAKSFDPKDTKLSVVTVSPRKQERTQGKLHFDLASLAGIPSASTSKQFKLSDKYSLKLTIDARFVKAGTGGSGSAGASSAMSGISARTSEDDDDDDLGDDDFGDLAVDDVPEPEVTAASAAKSRQAPPLVKPGAKPGSSTTPAGGVETTRATNAVERRKSPTVTAATTSERAIPSPVSPFPKGSHHVTAATTPERVSPSPVSPLPKGSAVAEKRRSGGRGSSSPLAGTSGLGLFKKDRGEEVARPEDVAKIAKLEEENAKLKGDLKAMTAMRNKETEELKAEVSTLKGDLEMQRRAVSSAVALRETADKKVEEVMTEKTELERRVSALEQEVRAWKKGKESVEGKYKLLESKNRELGEELDRLTVAVARKEPSTDGQVNEEIENRLASLRKEKESLEARVKAHETHSRTVRETYEKLSQMYDDLREHNAALQNEIDALKVKAEKKSESEAEEREETESILEDARQEVRDIEASKDALQSDYDRLLVQANSLQERLRNTSVRLEESQQENEDLHRETSELKGQRDMAMQRALSRGKSGMANDSASARSLKSMEEELRAATEKFKREQTRLTEKNEELQEEITVLKEDLEYEVAEKLKARNERDKIRENARELERRTSQAAKRDDVLHSLRRQLSTKQMREQDHEVMIADLREEKKQLEAELARVRNSTSKNSASDELNSVLADLVATKMALAQAEDEKLNLQFSMKQYKKNEKAIQQKLASHASRLEVKLGQANEELEKLRGRNGLADASEFNELGSDVDY